MTVTVSAATASCAPTPNTARKVRLNKRENAGMEGYEAANDRIVTNQCGQALVAFVTGCKADVICKRYENCECYLFAAFVAYYG